jgi:hypothetical protein
VLVLAECLIARRFWPTALLEAEADLETGVVVCEAEADLERGAAVCEAASALFLVQELCFLVL